MRVYFEPNVGATALAVTQVHEDAKQMKKQFFACQQPSAKLAIKCWPKQSAAGTFIYEQPIAGSFVEAGGLD
jgi:hypothetical protein